MNTKSFTIEFPHKVPRLEIIPAYADDDIVAASFREFEEEDFPDGDELLEESDLPEPIAYSDAQELIQDAYDRGFEDGKQVTAATMTVEIQEQQIVRKRFEQMLLKVQQEFTVLSKSMEELTVNLAVEIAQTIIGEQINFGSSMVIKQVKKAIDGYRNASDLIVRVNPEEFNALTEIKSELIYDTVKNPSLAIVADAAVEKGGCIVESDIGAVDAQIKTQLDEIRKQMHETRTSE